jgi:hypothetical protein
VGKSINWSLYNKSLINRGSITFWFPKDISESWYSEPSGRPGAQGIYSDEALEATSIIRFRFGLTLRATQGFVSSLITLMDLKLKIPDYTTLCRRLKNIFPPIKSLVSSGESIHVVMDSTGLKVYGEGEWKVRQHGHCKRRTWRKLHLAVDEKTSQIVAMELTKRSSHDAQEFERLIFETEEKIYQVSADGAYDTKSCYEESFRKKIKLVVPPREGAVIKEEKNNEALLERDNNIKLIGTIGKKLWKEMNNYHRRSIAETAVYRLKKILGDKLSSRDFRNQYHEARIKLH